LQDSPEAKDMSVGTAKPKMTGLILINFCLYGAKGDEIFRNINRLASSLLYIKNEERKGLWKPSNYENPHGSKGCSNPEDYLIPVICLMWGGLGQLDVRYNTVSSQCTRALNLPTDEFIQQVKFKSIVDLLEQKYPDQSQRIEGELKP
jgi:hypothetical protein